MKTLRTIVSQQNVRRVLGAIALLITLNLSLSVYEGMRLISELRSSLKTELMDLENFVIGQALVENQPAIDERLRLYQMEHPSVRIIWSPELVSTESFALRLPNRFVWTIPLRTIGQQNFGAFHVEGAYAAFQTTLKEFLIRTGFLIAFTVLIFILLLPLITQFPDRFLISPIQRTVEILEHPERFEERFSASSEIKEVSDLQDRIRALLTGVKTKTRVAALAEVASKVVHDIRSPVSSILMTIYDRSRFDPETHQILESSAKRIQVIAEGLLTKYRRPVPHHQESLLSSVQSLLREKEQEFQQQHKNLSIKTKLEVAPELSAQTLTTDGFDLIRVLSNLLNNAFESLTKVNSKVELSLSQKKGDLCIEIRDNGKGIPEHILERLGTEILTHGKGESGTGLGLFHAKRTVEQMKGSLRISSEEGLSTRVMIRLPLKVILGENESL